MLVNARKDARLDTKTTEVKARYIFRIEPSLIRRLDVIADAQFGGNRSLVVRDAITQRVEELERKLGIAPAESERAA